MCDFRTLAFDLDGTLLNDKKIITPTTLNTILKLHERGISIVLISGRHLNEIIKYAEMLQMRNGDFIVSCDGLYIYDWEGTLIYTSSFINIQKIKNCLNFRFKRAIFITSGCSYFIVNSLFTFLKTLIIILRNGFKDKMVRSLDSVGEHNVEKLVIDISNEEMVNGLRKEYTLHLVKDSTYEILAKNVNKYNALRRLAELNCICLDNVLYFGDYYNDIEAFTNISNCVVMGNAPEELKKYSMVKADTNNNDAIPKVIANYFGNQ